MSRVADALRKANLDSAISTPFHEDDHPWKGELSTRPVDSADATFDNHGEMRRRDPNVRNDLPQQADARRDPGLTVGEPTHVDAPKSPLAAFDASVQYQLERLVERIFLHPFGNAPRCVAFGGVDTDAGSASIAAAVAEIVARHTAASVCVVDTAVVTPSIHDWFGVPGAPGLAEALESMAPPAHAARQLRGNLWIVPSGEGATRLGWASVSRPRLSQLVDAFDHAILHLEPLTQFPAGLVSMVDGFVLVVAAESTRRDISRQLTATLKGSGATILGAVLTNRRDAIPEAIYRRL